MAAGVRPKGFKCCIAGHVLLQSGAYDEHDLLGQCGFHDGGRLWERAGDALGLTKAQRTELFFPSQWDQPHKQRYYLCASDEEAEVCAAYIDYFIAKHGVSEKSVESNRLKRIEEGAEHTASLKSMLSAV